MTPEESAGLSSTALGAFPGFLVVWAGLMVMMVFGMFLLAANGGDNDFQLHEYTLPAIALVLGVLYASFILWMVYRGSAAKEKGDMGAARGLWLGAYAMFAIPASMYLCYRSMVEHWP